MPYTIEARSLNMAASPAEEVQSLVHRAFCFMREAYCLIDEAREPRA